MTTARSNLSVLLNSVVDEVTEIIWWNRQLTKLDNPSFISNYEEFVKNTLVEIKGPYVENVRPPLSFEKSTKLFLESMDYSPVAIDSFIKVLFKGNGSLPLYWHQAESIINIEKGNAPVVISVPTATGKTECFLLPVLNYCVKSNERGLKALIIYPTKTLEVDQLNRFIRYINAINENPTMSKQVTIGIWDGDTPNSIGYDVEASQIPVNSFVRGLECPHCREKLRINDRGQLFCETDRRTFPWIKALRQTIKKGVDILITNPEALDFLQVNPDIENQQLLGEVPGKVPLKFIIFDEAHVWTGVTGSSIQLLIRRLLNYFEQKKPRLILLSATIADPEKMGMELSGRSKVEVIHFKSALIENPANVDFSRISPCSLQSILQTLVYIGKKASDLETICQKIPDCDNSLSMLHLLGLVNGEKTFSLTKDGKEILDCAEINSGEIIDDSEKICELFLDSEGFQGLWRAILLTRMPEISRVANYFPHATGKPSFAPFKSLINRISIESGLAYEQSEQVLLTCLNFGRGANILTDKYHVFIRPPREMFLCEKCKVLMTGDICSKCGEVGKEIRVCKTCHLPYIAVDCGKTEEDEGKCFVPLSHPLTNDGKCPSCFSRIKLSKPNVPYPTMITFLASAVCRLLPSHKTLIFSDSRKTAESIGVDLIENDYSLVAQQVIVRVLMDNGGSISSKDLYFKTLDELRARYYLYLHNEVDRNDEVSHRLIDEIEQQYIKRLATLAANQRLFDQALVTPQAILEFREPIDALLAHEIFKLIAKRHSFQISGKHIYGVTPARLLESLKKALPNLSVWGLEEKLAIILSELVDKHVILNPNIKDVLSEVNDSETSEDAKNNIETSLKNELEELNKRLVKANLSLLNSPVFQKVVYNPNYSVSLVKSIFYCEQCYSYYPSTGSGVFNCPKCGGKLKLESRWTEKNLGMLPETKIKYYLDHWGSDISHISASNSLKEIPYVSVGINRAGIPSSLRGIIEEGFRKSEPKINVISATPVMELGIDIGTLDVVCQIGIPPTVSNYVQRSGRAGRIRGRPSLIFTVIRGDHPIDSYFFDRIEHFLSTSDSLNIPDPFKFPTVLGTHVATETLAYLARNPDPRQIYSKLFTIYEFSGQARELSDLVILRLKALAQLVREVKRNELEQHIVKIFGTPGLDSFNKIFIEEGNESLVAKANEIYGSLSEMGKTRVESAEEQKQLGNWMSRLGFLANYRGTLKQLPIALENKKGSSTVEFKSYDYAIAESFPGPENTDGALFYVEAAKFIVNSVYGLSKELLKGKICNQYDICDFPYKVYSEDLKNCPFCKTELQPIQVHQIGPIKTRAARKLWDNFSTYPLQSQSIKFLSQTSNTELSFFDLPTKLSFGKTQVVSFTPAFEKKWSGRIPKVHLSEAKISQSHTKTSSRSPIDELLEEEAESLSPVGYSINTYALSIEIPRTAVESRLGSGEDWLNPISIVSLMQALKKAVCITVKCELQDFDIDFSATENSLFLYIYDTKEGGNNISESIKNDLLSKKSVLNQIKDIANCPYCSKYCDRCLLIQRTPSYMLKKDLLNRKELKRLLAI